MPKPALHQSSLAMLYKCPCQYEFRYIRGIIAPPSVAMVCGSGTHAAVSADLRHKIETQGELLSDEAIPDLARDGTVAAWDREGVRLHGDEKERGEKAVRGATIDRAVSLAMLHHGELAPTLQPIDVEHTWRLEIEYLLNEHGERVPCPYDLAGTFDIRESDSVRDTKTKAQSPPKGAADDSLQLTAYATAAKFIYGALPARVMLDCLVSTKKPKVVIVSSTRSDHDVEVFLRRLEVAMRQLEAGVFPPCNPGEWWCGPKWCGYHDRCQYV